MQIEDSKKKGGSGFKGLESINNPHYHMRIIILRSNPVRPDSRVEKEACSLSRNGHSVTVLCWDRDNNHAEEHGIITIANQNIPIVRLGYAAQFGAGMKSIIPYLKFQLSMRKWLKKHAITYDAIHACDFDTAFFSYWVAKEQNKKFVFDIFDYIATNPRNWFQKCIKKAEDRIINKADATIICTEDRKRQIEGTNPKRLVVIHNSPSQEQLPAELHIEGRSHSIIRVCYIGILQSGRLLKELGVFFSQHKEYEFHIGGFGLLEEYFQNLAIENDNIIFYGRTPYHRTLELEYNSDIMIAIYDPRIGNHKYAAPNKFYESLMLGKPVIMAKGTGMSEVVSAEDIGCVIDYNIDSFENGLSCLVSKREQWDSMSKKMQKLYNEKYNWAIMEKRLIDLYSEI